MTLALRRKPLLREGGLPVEEVCTVRDLTRLTRQDLLSLHNFGEKSLSVLEAALAANGLSLSDGSDGLFAPWDGVGSDDDA